MAIGRVKQAYEIYTRLGGPRDIWATGRLKEKLELLGAGAVPSGDRSAQRVIEALIGVIHDPGVARLVVVEAGYPPGAIPRFHTAELFWSTVTEEARCGRLPGGLQPIIDSAAKRFPYNEVFARCRSRSGRAR